MTDHETEAVLALAGLCMAEDPGARTFVDDLVWELKVHPWVKISARQGNYLWTLVERYRRYLPGALVVTAGIELRGV
jgi:hypothetical protein